MRFDPLVWRDASNVLTDSHASLVRNRDLPAPLVASPPHAVSSPREAAAVETSDIRTDPLRSSSSSPAACACSKSEERMMAEGGRVKSSYVSIRMPCLSRTSRTTTISARARLPLETCPRATNLRSTVACTLDTVVFPLTGTVM